jgi:hypothetical protein
MFYPNMTNGTQAYRQFGRANAQSNAVTDLFNYVSDGSASNYYRIFIVGQSAGTGLHWLANGTLGINTASPSNTLDVNGTTRSSNFRGSNGSVAVPTYSFVSDPSTGIHWAGTSQLAFDTSGVQRMVIRNGNVGIGTSNPVVALEVVGDVSAVTYNGPGGTASAPHYTFSDDRTTGVFFPGANIVGFTAGGTERMRISNASIGIGTTAPGSALDVSGVLRIIGSTGNITFSNGTVDISGTQVFNASGTLSNTSTTSNRIGGVLLSNADLSASRIFAPVIRNAVTATDFDISGGNLSNSATTRSSNFLGTATASNQIGGVTFQASDLSMSATGRILAPIIRNALIPSLFDMSGGNISNSGTTSSSNFIGTDASASNQIGGVTFQASDLSMSATGRILAPILRNALIPSLFDISSGNISNAGQTRSSNFLAAPGGASRPAYAFTTDPSSGLDLVGTSYLAFDTSGVQRMCISGNLVGIGTSAPGALLDLSGGGIRLWGIATNSTARPAFDTSVNTPPPAYEIQARTTSGADGFLRLRAGHTPTAASYIDLTGYSQLAENDRNIVFGTSQVERMRIFSNGNIGIGTVAPAYVLDVSAGNSAADTAIYLRNSAAANVANTTSIRFGTAGNSGTGQAMIRAGFDGGTAGGQGTLTFHTFNAGAGTMAERVRIDQSGNVGIGTTVPQSRLDVSGTVRFANSLALFDFIPAGPSAQYGNLTMNGYITVYKPGTTNKAPSNQMINLSPEAGIGSYFLSNNIGIGTSNPAFALDICGTIRALEGLKQGTNTWGAYSDERLKQEIQPADTSLCYSIVKSLPLRRFLWDASYVPGIRDRHAVGWIAQDVEKVFPRAVTTMNEFGFEDLRSLDPDQLYKTMYGALEKVIADKEALETKVNAQESLLQTILADKDALETNLSNVLTRLTALEASQQSSGSTQTTPPTPPPPEAPQE